MARLESFVLIAAFALVACGAEDTGPGAGDDAASGGTSGSGGAGGGRAGAAGSASGGFAGGNSAGAAGVGTSGASGAFASGGRGGGAGSDGFAGTAGALSAGSANAGSAGVSVGGSGFGGMPESMGGAAGVIGGAAGEGGSQRGGAGGKGAGGAGGKGGGLGGNAGSGAGAGGSGGGVSFPPGCTCLDLGPPACAPTGHVTYTLSRSNSPTQAESSAYEAITCAMEAAIAYYDCYTPITKALNVSYVPSVPTADGNSNGSIRFGGMQYMECTRAMHEIAHTVGIGTASNWSTYSVGGDFTGEQATREVRDITGNPDEVVHSDTQHFWPYGLNYASEAEDVSELLNHCRMVVAIRADLGLR